MWGLNQKQKYSIVIEKPIFHMKKLTVTIYVRLFK